MLSVAAFVSACNNPKANQTSEQAAVSTDSSGTNYVADTTVSALKWEATKIVGGHTGSIRINNGKLSIKEGNIVSGGFSIVMNTITNADLTDAKYNSDLVNHLKSPDFFNAAQFPNGKVEMSNATRDRHNGIHVTVKIIPCKQDFLLHSWLHSWLESSIDNGSQLLDSIGGQCFESIKPINRAKSDIAYVYGGFWRSGVSYLVSERFNNRSKLGSGIQWEGASARPYDALDLTYLDGVNLCRRR